MPALSKRYTLRDGTSVTVGECMLWGLLETQLYPNKDYWGWQSEVWTQAHHDYGCPDHRLKLLRDQRRSRRTTKGPLTWPPSWRWE